MKRKVLCLLLSLCVAVTMMPAVAFAANNSTEPLSKKVVSHKKQLSQKHTEQKKTGTQSKISSEVTKHIKQPLSKRKANIDDVAEINGVQYATLQEAINAVQSGQTIRLISDVFEENVKIANNKTFTIDMREYILSTSNTETARAISIESGNVTLKNGSVINEALLYDPALNIYAVGIYANTAVTLENMLVETFDDYSVGYYIDSNGKATITDCIYYDESDEDISADPTFGADMVEGFFIEQGATATLNSSGALLERDYGINIYGNAVLNDSDFIANGDYANGVSVGNTGRVTINGGNFWGDAALWMNDYGAKATIKRGSFEESYFDTSAIQAYVDTRSNGSGVTIAAGSSATPASWRTKTADKIVVDNKLATPSISKVSVAGATSLKLYWNKIAATKNYQIYRATSKNGKYSKIKTTTATSYTNTGLKNNKTYYYKVQAITSVSGGKNSSLSGYKSGKAALAKPVVKLKKTSKTKTKVSWKKVTGADGYYVYRAIGKKGKYKKIKTIKKGSTVSYTNTKLKRGKIYYYKVKAYDKVSKKTYTSPYSSAKRIKM